jgi:CheY-like chemotaxis protein
MPSPSVLLVEDDRDVREVIVRWLEKQGYRVCWTGTGAGAIRLLCTETIDLVLLDISLGFGLMNGWDVARYLFSDPRLASVPLIIVSGMPQEQLQEAARAGLTVLERARHIVTKPLDENNRSVILETLRALPPSASALDSPEDATEDDSVTQRRTRPKP